MDRKQKSEVKAKGVLLATGGLATALVVLFGFRLAGLASLSLDEWLVAVVATAVVQGAAYLIPHQGLDGRLRFDPHYVYTPLAGVLLLLALYVLLAPEARFIILLGWFVALLFMAGLGGFHSAVSLSGAMMLAYFGVAVGLARTGYPLSLPFEAAVAGGGFVISIFAGFVFEKLRAERREMRELRRRLSDMALTDPLTQLPNRRHFEQVLRAEMNRVRRHGGHCTVAMVDVDYFKHYNDSLGHLAGDTALRELADVMRRELRMHDMVARLGGEEFALLMINTSAEDTIPVVERLRRDVQEHPFRNRDIQPEGRLTVSAGIASFPVHGQTYDHLLHAADEALYRAKRAGRNRTCVAGSAEPVLSGQ